jgi:hypothetical protein
MRNHEPVAEPEYLTDAFSREAANYIQRLVQNQPGPPELYDLSVDISETKNIAKENGEVVRRLLQAHADWNAELISPLWAQAGAVPKNQGSPQSHPVGPAPAGSRIED